MSHDQFDAVMITEIDQWIIMGGPFDFLGGIMPKGFFSPDIHMHITGVLARYFS